MGAFRVGHVAHEPRVLNSRPPFRRGRPRAGRVLALGCLGLFMAGALIVGLLVSRFGALPVALGALLLAYVAIRPVRATGRYLLRWRR
jgi:hypothetical protein